MLLPRVIVYAYSNNLFDSFDSRKLHTDKIPRLGGLVFLPAVSISILATLIIDDLLELHCISMLINIPTTSLIYGAAAILLLYSIGLADDLNGVSYRAKFSIQIISATLLVLGNLGVDSFASSLNIHQACHWVNTAATFLTVLLIVNATNLIDGLDGLAAGLASMALLFYSAIFAICGDYLEMLLALATLGVMGVFFYFNVFGYTTRHHRIYMGDTGSLTLGFILALLSIRIVSVQGGVAAQFSINPYLLAFSPLAVISLDTIRVFIERVLAHKNPFMPDRRHIHFRFLETGIGQHSAMVSIIAISLLITLLNIYLSTIASTLPIILLDVAIYSLTMQTAANKNIAAHTLQTRH